MTDDPFDDRVRYDCLTTVLIAIACLLATVGGLLALLVTP